MQFIDLHMQYKHLKPAIDNRIKTVLDHGKYIMGPEVQELEAKLADYVGVKHVISCANCTDALTLCMMTLGIKAGDAVFCPTFTYFATAEAISATGATPVFVDSDLRTFNICPLDLEKQILNIKEIGEIKPKAIIAVDLFGLPANYPELKRISAQNNLKIIEDAAQGFGGEINGKRAGSFGDMAATSFFPAKPLGCYGDGGAIFTDNDDYAELLRSYSVHGKGSDKYDNIRIGMNSRLDTIQAAILLEKIEAFPTELIKRNQIAEQYTTLLKNNFVTPSIPDGYLSSWAEYTIVDSNRSSLMTKLKAEKIPSMIFYKTCMHQQTAFKHLNYKKGDFPIAEGLAKQVFSLPMHPYLSSTELDKVIDIIQI